ncbi:MAG: cytochrome c3 family protein [Acidobacteria bacterium]|nr:cytochrome c3 family protein [Acidobacteriota bacterium]
MAQVFHRSANTLARLTLVLIVLLLGLAIGGIMGLDRSDYVTDVSFAKAQPIQFSHQHHAGALGIQCVYCHSTVETSSFAGIPPTHTCMSCHSQIWIDSPMLEPVRASYRTGEPLQWVRVHDLPEFVFFNHSIHVNKGIGCSTCHGRVDQMPQVFKVATLQMEWCLNCHRQPEMYIRPRDRIYDMAWQPPPNQLEVGRKLMQEYKVLRLVNCYTCHR